MVVILITKEIIVYPEGNLNICNFMKTLLMMMMETFYIKPSTYC